MATWLISIGLVSANIAYVYMINKYVQMTNEEVSRIEVLRKDMERTRQGRTMYQQR